MSSNGYHVAVDSVDQAEWAATLDRFEDANLYQTYAYGAVRWGAKNLSHLIVHADGEPLAIAQIRIVRPMNLKCGIAYLRWGPLWVRRGSVPDSQIAAYMADALEQEYAVKRGLLLRVLPNAFAGTERAAAFQTAFQRFTTPDASQNTVYRTFVLDLAPSLEELRAGLDKKWRNALSRSEKNGLEIIGGDGMEEYQTFCRIYQEMMNRKRFETSVSVEEFGRIQQELPKEQRMQTLICLQEGVPVAGLVCSAMGDSAIYLLGATSDSGMNAKGAYLLQWTWIQQLKARGTRWYDLGGIDPERNPGVYHFKSGMSGVDSTHIGQLNASNGGVSSTLIRSGETALRKVTAGVKRLRARAQSVAAVEGAR